MASTQQQTSLRHKGHKNGFTVIELMIRPMIPASTKIMTGAIAKISMSVNPWLFCRRLALARNIRRMHHLLRWRSISNNHCDANHCDAVWHLAIFNSRTHWIWQCRRSRRCYLLSLNRATTTDLRYRSVQATFTQNTVAKISSL